ncbi:YggS family pyridoxal phosphate-dependent enzyme [Chitinibacter bivalviorum]|uniref:Pyridoxal phosphate homeostasis protein n=1 Tax=Chitinibacter bivalviorum TaxID=2739434 RepID=A0A7H9BE07_9NEIS|nr:YggS family pyridoxal phosphate-dependent enzyme [Chitinibacter bivalviorum]QLG86950.1 YggS family pyridoxal phosphate-dependent enzyme [Chitinibacter bivalviorum]
MATLFEAWQGVQGRIDAACTACGRNSTEVALLAVSKTFPALAVRELYIHGQRCFGENYAQELAQKCIDLADCSDIEWHFIGPLQSNKTRIVAESAHWVHTIDRFKIAERLNNQRPAHLPALNVCIQVNVSGEASKSGIHPDQLLELATAIRQLPHLQLRGLMCIPEATSDEDTLAKQFQSLKYCQAALQDQGFKLDTLSMGMSADLELAIASGTTLVRVGSAIFGARHYQQEKQ